MHTKLRHRQCTCAFLSQFRGIAEFVKEFMEYIANEMMAAHKNAVVIADIRLN